jgi:hypothetical protein
VLDVILHVAVNVNNGTCIIYGVNINSAQWKVHLFCPRAVFWNHGTLPLLCFNRLAVEARSNSIQVRKVFVVSPMCFRIKLIVN